MTLPDMRMGSKKVAKRLGFWVGKVPKDLLWAGLAGLSGIAGVGLGVVADRTVLVNSVVGVGELPVAGIIAAPEGSPAGMATSTASASTTLPADAYVVVAKTGTKYYYPWCGGAKRINAANLVTFASSTEAEAHGYVLAAHCAKP